MFKITLHSIKKNQAKIDFDTYDTNLNYIFNTTIDRFTNKNPNVRYQKFGKSTICPITLTGLFPIGLFNEITKVMRNLGAVIEVDSELRSFIKPLKNIITNIVNPNNTKYQYRDYQLPAIQKCMDNGRGIILLPTGSGKSLCMSGLINNIKHHYPNLKTFLVLVPTIQLVTQMHKDFIEYGDDHNDIQVFSGFSNDLDSNRNIIIANRQYVDRHSEELPNIDVVIVDECHGISDKTNNVSKYVRSLATPVKFGFTGTLPTDIQEKYNVMGVLGSVLHEEKITKLQEQKHISDISIYPIRIIHSNKPRFIYNTPEERMKAYPDEWNYIEKSKDSNDVIVKIVERLNGNTLLLTDHLEYNDTIFKAINREYKFKIIGETELEHREEVKEIMKIRNDVVLCASKQCFQLGINIPSIKNILIVNGGKSFISIVQSIGRGLRLDKDKSSLVLLDVHHNLKYSEKHFKHRLKIYNTTYDKQNLKITEINI